MKLTYYQREQANEIPIFNPKDSNNKRYFKFGKGMYRNKSCSITEKEYERLCELNGTNPLYPRKNISIEEKIRIKREICTQK